MTIFILLQNKKVNESCASTSIKQEEAKTATDLVSKLSSTLKNLVKTTNATKAENSTPYTKDTEKQIDDDATKVTNYINSQQVIIKKLKEIIETSLPLIANLDGVDIFNN
jgi:DNA-directed RNA polymerase specialized sigma subunit